MDSVYIVLGIAIAAVLAVSIVFLNRRKAGPTLGASNSKPPTRASFFPEGDPTRRARESLAEAGNRIASSASFPAVELPSPHQPPARDVAGVRTRMRAAREGFASRLAALLLGRKEMDPSILEQIEEIMLTSDVGVKTTQSILERLRQSLAKSELQDSDAVWAALREEATRIVSVGSAAFQISHRPSVILFVGVNGVGKTTSIGKLATQFQREGRRVILAAGDTFRAAAVEQLEVWGKRCDAPVIKGKDGADPGSVAFDAVTRCKELKGDLLLIDTAGRLHTKAPLMDEIRKVRKTIDKAMPGAPHETLLVLDATTGQNALSQAAMFKEAVEITGIVLTKLDGTAKGGIILGICDELQVPVRYIGLGERPDDLREFQPDEFVEALFGRDENEAHAA